MESEAARINRELVGIIQAFRKDCDQVDKANIPAARERFAELHRVYKARVAKYLDDEKITLAVINRDNASLRKTMGQPLVIHAVRV